MIILFFIIFVPLVTKQINYFSTIDSEKLVQIVEGPINKIEQLFKSINPDISDQLSLKDYISSKVSGILNAEMIQNFLGSLVGILGNMMMQFFLYHSLPFSF